MRLIQVLLFITLFITLFVVLAACASQGERVCTLLDSQSRHSHEPAQKWIETDHISAIDVANGFAYVSVGNAFVILDVKDPSRIKQVGELILSNWIRSIDVVGERAYVNGSRGSEHHLVDLTNPSHPREIRCQEDETMPPLARGVGKGEFAYVSDLEDGSLNIYEVGRDEIVQLASYQSFLPPRLQLNPDFEIISEPRFVSDVAVAGDTVYVAENRGVSGEVYLYEGRIHVLDVSDPAKPRSVSVYDVPQGVAISNLFVQDNSLIASAVSWNGTFTIMLDVADPAEPEEVEVVSDMEFLLGVANGYAYFKYIEVMDYSGIRVRKLADITQASDWDELNLSRYPSLPTVEVAGDYAYFVSRGPGIIMVDVTDPVNPRLAGTFTYSPADDTE